MYEMNDTQKELFNKLTPLQREVALNKIAGMNDIDAYKNSKGKAKKENTMRASASEILTNPNVSVFIDSMANHIVNPAIMTRDAMLELQTKIASIGDKQLETMSLESLNELKGSMDIKLKAMNQIADVLGYKSAQKYDHSSSDGSMSPKGRDLSDFYADDV